MNTSLKNTLKERTQSIRDSIVDMHMAIDKIRGDTLEIGLALPTSEEEANEAGHHVTLIATAADCLDVHHLEREVTRFEDYLKSLEKLLQQ